MNQSSIASLILRLGMCLPMITHGWPKFQRLLDGNFKFGNPIGLGEPTTILLAVLSEFIAPLIILIGWKTRLFSFFPAATMFVAVFFVHLDDPWNKMEKPILFLCGFLTIMTLGGGRYSLDGQLSKR